MARNPTWKNPSRAWTWFFLAAVWTFGFAAAGLIGHIKPWRRPELFVLAAVGAIVVSCIAWRHERIAKRGIAIIAALCATVALGFATNHYLAVRAGNRSPVGAAVLEAAHKRAAAGSHPRLWFASLPPTSAAYAEALLNGQVALLEQRPAAIAPDRWSDRSYERPRAWMLLLHAMPWLDALNARYKATSDARYLQRAEEFVLGWIDANSTYVFTAPSEFSWNDHSTAIRATAWLRFWEAWHRSALWDRSKARRFLSSLFAHAVKLADPSFYTRRHNHGIDQDIALASIAAAFPEHRDSQRWTELAFGRVVKQIEHLLSPNGVQLEHSPDYQLVTLAHLSELRELAMRIGVELRAHGMPLGALLERMRAVAALFLMPDGRFAPIGDTDRRVVARHPLLQDARAKDGLSVLKQEGYAVFRQRARYFLFTAASHKGLAHKHRDDLSFVLYACGRMLIDDGGHVSYETDEQRAFTVGPYAHNSVVIGTPTVGPVVRARGRTKLTRAVQRDGVVEVQGVTEESGNYRHTRTVRLRAGELVVEDHITPLGSAPTAAEWTQIFNADPAVQIVPPTGAIVTTLKGRQEPMIGWRAPKFGSALEPRRTVAVRVTGASSAVTVLRFPADCEPRR